MDCSFSVLDLVLSRKCVPLRSTSILASSSAAVREVGANRDEGGVLVHKKSAERGIAKQNPRPALARRARCRSPKRETKASGLRRKKREKKKKRATTKAQARPINRRGERQKKCLLVGVAHTRVSARKFSSIVFQPENVFRLCQPENVCWWVLPKLVCQPENLLLLFFSQKMFVGGCCPHSCVSQKI